MNSHIENENPFTFDEVVSSGHAFMVAGHETTANTLSWAFYYLALYPIYQDILRKEAKEMLDENESVKFEKVMDNDNFKMTKAFINEVLRLKSPAPAVARKTSEESVFSGHKVPKGTLLIVAFRLLNSSEKYWGNDVDEFRPERFLEDRDFKSFFFSFFNWTKILYWKKIF